MVPIPATQCQVVEQCSTEPAFREQALPVVCRGSSSFLFNQEIPKMFFLMIHDDILPAHIFFWGFLFVSLVPIGKLRLTILGYVCAAPLMLDWPLRIDQHFDTLCTEIYVYTVDVYKDYIDTCSRPWCIIHPKASPRSANSAERIVIATKKGFHVGQVVQLCMAAVAQKYKIEWLGQKNGYPTE